MNARPRAELLLSEQRHYAGISGDADPLARSLCNFSHSLWKHDSAIAVAWAEEARSWQPWDPYAWNTLIGALRSNSQHSEAVSTGWQAIARFPDSEVAWNDLGAALANSQRFIEAEEVFWQSTERFPNRPYGWRGLGDVMRRVGEFDRAENVYRTALSAHCPENSFLIDGLGNVLKAKGEYAASALEYKRAVTIDPSSAYSWRGLAMALKADGQLYEAIDAIEEGLKHSPEEEYLVRSLNSLRQQAKAAEMSENEFEDQSEPEVEQPASTPIPSQSQLAEMSAGERESVLSMARSLRRAARRRRDEISDGAVPRKQATQILGLMREARPWEVRPMAESMIAAAEGEDAETVESLLAEATDRFPESPQLAYFETRVRREIAGLRAQRFGVELDPTILDEILEPVKRIRRIDRSLHVVEQLETLRAATSFFMDRRNDLIDRTVASIRTYVDQADHDDTFRAWTAKRVQFYLFNDDANSPLETVCFRAGEYSRELDAMTEDIVNRVILPSR